MEANELSCFCSTHVSNLVALSTFVPRILEEWEIREVIWNLGSLLGFRFCLIICVLTLVALLCWAVALRCVRGWLGWRWRTWAFRLWLWFSKPITEGIGSTQMPISYVNPNTIPDSELVECDSRTWNLSIMCIGLTLLSNNTWWQWNGKELVDVAVGTPLEDPETKSIGVAAGDFDGDGQEEVDTIIFLLTLASWIHCKFRYLPDCLTL